MLENKCLYARHVFRRAEMVFKSSPIYEKTFFIAHSSAIPDLFQTWKRESWSISLFSSKASWTKLAIASACFDVTCGCISRYLFGDRFSKKSNSIRFCYSDMLLLFLVQLHVLVEFSLLAPCAVRGGTVTTVSSSFDVLRSSCDNNTISSKY